ncbi:MAG TPA: glycoside hydrolase family 15 protein [Phycisphaerales bacterium]|nr:glycoside hydrolase family 15 protein [Phycisphaerales bacterium]
MPRDIPVGNGSLLITFDDLYRVRDIYYPCVGQPNHTQGNIQRFGVWADGEFAWIEDDGWTREKRYKPDTLVTEVRLVHERLGLEITCNDAVDQTEPVYFRRSVVRDLLGRDRDVRLFFHYDLSIGGNPVGDTANYDPNTNGVVFYKDGFYFIVNACDQHKCGIDHWAIGTKRIGGAEGTWRDAEDGHLGRNTIAQGSVDATIGFNLHIPANGETHVTNWFACGRSYEQIERLNQRIWETGADRMIFQTEAYWRIWAHKEGIDTSSLPESVADMYYRSALILRTQVDNGGAIIAANDSDIAQFGGDHYSYCWPRDGALCAYALILTGQSELSRRFFRFCAGVIEKQGYFLHKYNPSGSLASSWHPWTLDGQKILPIQQDETSLVIWALRKHFETYRDVEFIKSVYDELIVRPADWIVEYRDANGLPKQSWDLWEERRGVHTFTVASTIGALKAAAAFCHDFGEPDRSATYTEAAERMTLSFQRHFWHEPSQRFARRVVPQEDGSYRLDMVADASNFALFAIAGLDPNDPKIDADLTNIRKVLSVQTEIGGVARYQNDYYHQIESKEIDLVPGNPWVICTLWQAQHIIAKATTRADLTPAMDLINWCCYRQMDSGVLAEQFDPYSGEPISVSPLTWSHATVMIVVSEYLNKLQALTHAGTGTPHPSFFGVK